MPTRRRPKPTLVLLVRHGHTPTTGKLLPGRAKGLHLSDDGRKQAQVVADRIATLPKVDAVYASPLERTRETAAPIARAHGMRVRPDKRLLEVDVGEWTGWELKKAAKTEEWKTVQQRPSAFRFPGGESFLEMQGRIVDAIERIRAGHPGGTVVAVSHADPIKAAAADAVGTPLDLFQRIVISPCSVTAILYGDSSPIALTVNSTGDLKGLAPS
ncbi:MAG: MSMEG_4193 family putative phosphomutase [Acidimicrobiia bacterium]|nr:MSMEG_4193 family putative phosphomutase [Acidimicrobiia bacterium]